MPVIYENCQQLSDNRKSPVVDAAAATSTAVESLDVPRPPALTIGAQFAITTQYDAFEELSLRLTTTSVFMEEFLLWSLVQVIKSAYSQHFKYWNQ